MPPADGDHAAPEPTTGTRSPPEPSGADGAPRSDPASDGVDIDTAEVDPVLFRTFWGSVIAVNVAMAAIPLGILLIHFRGAWDLGALAIAVGAVAGAGAVRFYLTFRADRREDGEAEGARGP